MKKDKCFYKSCYPVENIATESTEDPENLIILDRINRVNMKKRKNPSKSCESRPQTAFFLDREGDAFIIEHSGYDSSEAETLEARDRHSWLSLINLSV